MNINTTTPELVQLKDLKNIEVVDIKQFENFERDRPEFENRYYKILYFFLKEGLFSTLRKYFAHRQPQQRYLTLLYTRDNQKRYINISIQSQTDPIDFVLENRFFECADKDIQLPVDNLEPLFSSFNQYAGYPDYRDVGLEHADWISYDITSQEFDRRSGSGVFIFGLGGYVRMFIIQHFRKMNKIACVDYKAGVTREFKEKYGFEHSFLVPAAAMPLLASVDHPVAIIATYHSDHAALAQMIFNHNPNATIFIEKPPTVTLNDLDILLNLFNRRARMEFGFNRRYIGLSRFVKENLQGKPVVISCTVKEVRISDNHWYLWKNQGTRVTGNVVHWFDLGTYWIQSDPVEINVMAHPEDLESSAISVLYKDGSLLNISASDRGNSLRGVQEKIELRVDNETYFIDDFNSLTHLRRNGVKIRKRKLRRIKGHVAMYKAFKRLIDNGSEPEYPFRDLVLTSLVTYYASHMLQNNIRSMNIEKPVNEYLSRMK